MPGAGHARGAAADAYTSSAKAEFCQMTDRLGVQRHRMFHEAFEELSGEANVARPQGLLPRFIRMPGLKRIDRLGIDLRRPLGRGHRQRHVACAQRQHLLAELRHALAAAVDDVT